MPQGVPTDEATLAEFRAEYLYSGNASASGRKLDIPERTARQLAERLEAEPDFAEARRLLRTHALERLVLMRMTIAETAHSRYLDDLPMPQVDSDANVTIVDKRYEDGKLVLEAEKNAQHLAKFEAERDAEKNDAPAKVEVHVHLKDDPSDSSQAG